MKLKRSSKLALAFLSAINSVCLTAVSVAALAATPPSRLSSAARPKGVDAHFFIEKALNNEDKSRFPGGTASVVSSKRPINRVDWLRVPHIDTATLGSSFESVREERPFQDENSRARRATWLYPDDGCFVRAVIADKVLREKFSVSRSAKIFAFGNLRVPTSNSPTGEVEWWYHVASVTRVASPSGDQVFVYDPAIDSAKPLPVHDWLSLMSDPGLEVAICSGSAYDPYSECEGDEQNLPGAVSRAFREASLYLMNEWERVTELGRDPHQELLK